MKQCLVVDDSKIVRKLSRRIMEKLGYTVEEAEDGSKAVEACQKSMPDLILLDWYMPVMDGLECVKKLRTLTDGNKPKVIFCTTENAMDHIMQAMQAGANEYVMKPFDEEIIKGKLEQLGILS